MFYQMRFHGLRRKSKPWPNASDVHFPLADSIIERLKPHYFQQLFATDQIAAFTVNKQGIQSGLASQAASWFDYQIKQKSNLESEVLVLIDKMLLSGRPVMKVVWEAKPNRLRFVAVPAHMVIVPMDTRRIEDADRIVHVMKMSIESYKRDSNYKQDAAFIQSITGNGSANETNTELTEATYRREGLTHTDEADQIILWEVWEQDSAGGWKFTTVSPVNPAEPVRETTGCPYAHKLPPFVDFPYEVTDDGWYSPRGVVECVAVFEAELCKLLNEKNDAMTLMNRPLFRAEKDIPNAANYRWLPGQILPAGVEPIPMPPPPISYDQQIILMRDIAERKVAVPDYAMSEVRASKDNPTATQVNALAAVANQSADLRLRTFRLSLGKLYRMAWALLVQYAQKDLAAYDGDGKEVKASPEALRDVYAIAPSGSSDGVNKSMAMSKAVARLQMFNQDPFINQAELRKSVLEADDAGLVRRLFTDPGYSAATQAEDQAQELSILRMGFPALVTPADDHAVHIQTILAYIAHQSEIGEPPKPSELQFIQQHAAEHVAALKKIDPAKARQAQDALASMPAMLQAQAGPTGDGKGLAGAQTAMQNPVLTS